MTIVRVLLLAAVLAGGTWVLGWWAVPVGGALYALLRRDGAGVPGEAALAAAIGWGALLVAQATHPSFGRLSQALAGIFPLPTWGLMLLSLLFAAALAGSAAALVRSR